MVASLRKRVSPVRSRPAYRTLSGWALGVLLDEGVVTECEYHGHRRDRGDPDALRRARERAWGEPFQGATPETCIKALEEELRAIGDTCPGCD
jgi:hypothetical protein